MLAAVCKSGRDQLTPCHSTAGIRGRHEYESFGLFFDRMSWHPFLSIKGGPIPRAVWPRRCGTAGRNDGRHVRHDVSWRDQMKTMGDRDAERRSQAAAGYQGLPVSSDV